MLLAAFVGTADAGRFTASLPDDKEQARIQALLDKQVLARRKAIAARRAWNNMRVFKDKNGAITLTNRPEKYTNNKDLVEFKMDYDPIEVPDRFRAFMFSHRVKEDDIKQLAKHYAERYLLDESLVLAVIKVESNFDPKAVSRAGARGLMQLMPATAAEMGVTDIFDPAQNIAAGTQYLAKLLNAFNHDLDLALAAYNAGPATVKRYGGTPPYKETRLYVRRVNEYAARFAQGSIPLTGLGIGTSYGV